MSRNKRKDKAEDIRNKRKWKYSVPKSLSGIPKTDEMLCSTLMLHQMSFLLGE